MLRSMSFRCDLCCGVFSRKGCCILPFYRGSRGKNSSHQNESTALQHSIQHEYMNNQLLVIEKICTCCIYKSIFYQHVFIKEYFHDQLFLCAAFGFIKLSAGCFHIHLSWDSMFKRVRHTSGGRQCSISSGWGKC